MPHEPPSSTSRRIEAVPGLIVLISLVVLLVVKVVCVATLFGRPGELTYPAAANACVAQRVQNGGPIYGDWRERPHLAAWYGPALYVPVAVIGRWINADGFGLFMIGRWISLVCFLGTSCLIGWVLLVHWRADRTLAVISVLMFAIADDVLERFDLSFRPDMPACFLTLLGLALVIRWDRAPALYGSIGVFLLAFLYKQSTLVGPPAVAAWLWLTGRPGRSLLYAGLSAAVLGGSVVVMNLLTDGRYLLNTVTALRGNTAFLNVPQLLMGVAEAAPVPLVVALFAVGVGWGRRHWDLLTIAFVVGLLLAAAATYRDGSWRYYYLPPVAIACVLFGRQLSQWWRGRSAVPAAATALVLALVLAAVVYVPRAALSLADLPTHWRNFRNRGIAHRQRADFFDRLARYLNDLDAPVLCQFNTIALLCPKLVMVDCFTFTSMADVGVFDDSVLIDEIRTGRIAAIVLNPRADRMYQSTDMFSRRWRDAMRGVYRRVDEPGLSPAIVYRPISRAPEGSSRKAGPSE